MDLSYRPKDSTEEVDSYGPFVRYQRICQGCQVDLTSRNRVSKFALMCRPCYNAKERRDYLRETGGGYSPRSPSEPGAKKGTSEVHLAALENRKKVHALLAAFLDTPTNKATKDALLSSLVDYELIVRFRHL